MKNPFKLDTTLGFLVFDIETIPKFWSSNDGKIDPNSRIALEYRIEREYNSKGHEYDKDTYLKDKAGLNPAFNQIVCISYQINHMENGKWLSEGGSFKSRKSEKNVLNKFNSLVEDYEDVIYLCGHGIEYFDVPQIMVKLRKYGINPARNLVTYNVKPWESKIIDLNKLVNQSYLRMGLSEMACLFDVDNPKRGITGSQVASYFWESEDKDQALKDITKYCRKDVSATSEILKKYING